MKKLADITLFLWVLTVILTMLAMFGFLVFQVWRSVSGMCN